MCKGSICESNTEWSNRIRCTQWFLVYHLLRQMSVIFYNQCWIGTFVIWVELYPTTIDFFALDHSIVTESLWTNNCFYVEKDANKSHTKCNSSKQFKFPCNKFLFTHEHTIDCVLCKSLIVYVCIACFYWYKTEVFTET